MGGEIEMKKIFEAEKNEKISKKVGKGKGYCCHFDFKLGFCIKRSFFECFDRFEILSWKLIYKLQAYCLFEVRFSVWIRKKI
jgi:hypothetical protein